MKKQTKKAAKKSSTPTKAAKVTKGAKSAPAKKAAAKKKPKKEEPPEEEPEIEEEDFVEESQQEPQPQEPEQPQATAPETPTEQRASQPPTERLTLNERQKLHFVYGARIQPQDLAGTKEDALKKVSERTGDTIEEIQKKLTTA